MTAEKEEPERSTARRQDESIRRNLMNAMDGLKPDRYGVSADAEKAIASLNDWEEYARKRAEKEGLLWEPRHTGRLLESLPKEWVENIKLDRFVTRDAAFIRDAIWANAVAELVTERAESDLERALALFQFTVRNLELLPSDEPQVPLAPFEKVLLGRGTAEDRAWLFAELLRQRQIDAILLAPRRAPDDDRRRWILVGVLLDSAVYLFDPYLGVPIPVDIDRPETAIPQTPATFRDVQQNPVILESVARDTGGAFPLTAESLAAARAELICHTAWLSSRMRLLQRELAGDFQVTVSDPLEDTEDVSGLWRRVVEYQSATWSEEELALWAYPERHLEAASRLNEEQHKRLFKMTLPLGAPVVLQDIKQEKEGGPPEFVFSRPKRELMKSRINQLLGHFDKSAPGYLAARLYEIDPPTSKDLSFDVDGKRRARGYISQKYPKVKDLHESAADYACFWLIQIQAEQHRPNAMVTQARQYLEQHSSGKWTEAAKSFLANGLARQKRFTEAIKVAQSIDTDMPSAAGQRLLINRWKRLEKPDSDRDEQ